MDIDGNGSSKYPLIIFFYWIKNVSLVEFDEFVKIMRTVYERKFTDDEMRRAFKCFDRDNSGKRFLTENFICFIFL